MTVAIRSRWAGDVRQIIATVVSAFRRSDHEGREELQIVTRTWNCHAVPPGLELVAVSGDDEVVAHVVAAAGLLYGSSKGPQVVLGVALLSVRPEFQRRGIGSSLTTELLHRASTGGWPLAVVLGDPAYYERFGFEPAATLDISYGPVGAGHRHFMVHRLRPEVAAVGGEFSYCWELYPDGRDTYTGGDDLPPYVSAPVRLMCEHGVEVPLFPQPAFIESLVPPELLVRLKSWQEDFERSSHWDQGWASVEARDRWARTGREIEPVLRSALAGKAEVADLWPLRSEGSQEP